MKKRWVGYRLLSVCMAFLLAFPMVAPMASYAAEDVEFIFSETWGAVGDEIAVPITIRQNSGIATFRFRIAYDMASLSFLSAEKGTVLDSGTLSHMVDEENETLTLLWYSLEDVKADGEIVILRFRITDELQSTLPLTVTWRAEDVLSSDYTQVPYTVTVKPYVAVSNVTLDRVRLSMKTGASNTAQLVATVSPQNATCKEVVFESSDTSVVTVDKNGNVKALKKGAATVSVRTRDGGLVAQCTVTVACGHPSTTDHAAVESTCVLQGNAAYTTCNGCGAITAGSDAKLPLGTTHVGGTATCTAKAICTRCGKAYGNKAAHTYSGACDASCNVCGGTRTAVQHTYSNACDASCNVCSETRTPSAHVYSGACDASCNVCGATRTASAHTYSGACDASCNVCGATRTASAHQYTYVCSTVCVLCGESRTTARAHTYSNACDASCNVCGTKRATSAHVYGGACDASCNECGASRTVSSKHSGKSGGACSVCGEWLFANSTADNLQAVADFIAKNGTTDDDGNKVMIMTDRRNSSNFYYMFICESGGVRFRLFMDTDTTSGVTTDCAHEFLLTSTSTKLSAECSWLSYYGRTAVDGRSQKYTFDRLTYTQETQFEYSCGGTYVSADTAGNLMNSSLQLLCSASQIWLQSKLGLSLADLGFFAYNGTGTAHLCDPANGSHLGQDKLFGYRAPTATTEGYSGDLRCSHCGKVRKKGAVISTSGTLGDVNKDGKVDSTDARLVLQYAVKKIGTSALNVAVADVDGSGKVDSTDARLILQYAVRKIDTFPAA